MPKRNIEVHVLYVLVRTDGNLPFSATKPNRVLFHVSPKRPQIRVPNGLRYDNNNFGVCIGFMETPFYLPFSFEGSNLNFIFYFSSLIKKSHENRIRLFPVLKNLDHIWDKLLPGKSWFRSTKLHCSSFGTSMITLWPFYGRLGENVILHTHSNHLNQMLPP